MPDGWDDAQPPPETPTPAEPLPARSRDFAARFRHFAVEIPDFHKTWYDALDEEGVHDLILAPRESAKSSVVISWIEHMLVNDRQLRAGYLSKTEEAARAFLREIKYDFEHNDELLAVTGRLRPEHPTVWGANAITIAGATHGKDVSVFAVGITGQLPSRRVDILVLDDIETLETVKTPESRAATRERLAKEAFGMVAPGGKIVVVGTRKHDDDYYGTIIRASTAPELADGEPAPAETPAELGLFRILDNCTRAILPDGGSYWPEKWSLPALARKKRLLDATNIRAWSSEYMNTIVPPETQMFDPEQWPTWTVLPAGVEFWQAWDVAIGLSTRNDYTVGVTIAVDHDYNVYLVDVYRERVSFHAQQEKMAELGFRYMPEAIGIEAVAYQQSAVQEALRTSPLPFRPLLTNRGRAGSVVGLMRQTSDTRTIGSDKVSRARLIEARASVGKILRPAAPVPWWPDFAAELAYFPDSTHDDQVDALAYALGLLLQGASANEWARHMQAKTPSCSGCGAVVFDDRDTDARALVCPACSTVVREDGATLRAQAALALPEAETPPESEGWFSP